MKSIETGLKDPAGYLERMSRPLQEKMRIAAHLEQDQMGRILDVGCADGVVTKALSQVFPGAAVKGIDLNADFILKAQQETPQDSSATFERVYLRDMLARPERFDAVTFVSVLHEFYTYGEGISSVVKAVADTWELLNPGAKLIIRDMILPESARMTLAPSIIAKIRGKPAMAPLIADFERAHGPLDTLYAVNHFLLKYMYTDNWERECKEHYVPVALEQYEKLFDILGAQVEHKETYLIPYLRDTWRADFGLSDEELALLSSTTIIVARKPAKKPAS